MTTEKDRLKDIAIVGLGALGTLYAYHLTKALGRERVCVLADKERISRYESEGVFFNGEKCAFRYADIAAGTKYPSLIMICCKYTALQSVIEELKGWVGPETLMISVLNGIASEKDLRAVFPADQVIDCVARKMSAVKEGNRVTAVVPGELVIGPEPGRPVQKENAGKVAALLDEAAFPYVLSDEIQKELWSKLLCNVGANQSAMVNEVTYAGLQAPGLARDDMIAAMREVKVVAQAEGVALTEADVDYWVKVIDSLDPEGEPSMRQDGKARRRSEVELFSGTIVRLAKQHGLSVPVNEKWYDEIRQRESRYSS